MLQWGRVPGGVFLGLAWPSQPLGTVPTGGIFSPAPGNAKGRTAKEECIINRLSGAEALFLREQAELHMNLEKNFFELSGRCGDNNMADLLHDMAREHQSFHKILSSHLHNYGY
jgi:hypothetical protein